MHSIKLFWTILLIFIALVSCDQDEDYNTSPDFKLTFSTDTVAFDTLFTGFASTTKRMKVYNTSPQKIKISTIALSKSNSPFRVNINGIETNQMADVEIKAKDSLYVFVEVGLRPGDQDEPRHLEDHLLFDVNGKQQRIVFDAWAQDVYRINNNLETTQIWTGNRPYVVDKAVWIEKQASLTIQAGARIHFRKNAALHVKGTMEVKGSFEKPVYFEGSRLEDLYENVPGQWDGIYFYSENKENSMSHFILKNGKNGLVFTDETSGAIHLEYGIVSNFTEKGIAIANSDLTAHDLLLVNCGQECLRMEGNGSFKIYHSTVYNGWIYSARSDAAIAWLGTENASLLLENSIVWGIKSNEVHLDQSSNVQLQYTLLKLSNSKQKEYTEAFLSTIFNEDPLFGNKEEYSFTLGDGSPAINKGNPQAVSWCKLDLAGNPRNQDKAPDLGAYEYQESE